VRQLYAKDDEVLVRGFAAVGTSSMGWFAYLAGLAEPAAEFQAERRHGDLIEDASPTFGHTRKTDDRSGEVTSSVLS
jgi:hypothetical protein